MAVVPPNFRTGNHFEPLTNVSKTDRVDKAVSASLAAGAIIRPGHWLEMAADGVNRPSAESSNAFESWVEYDLLENQGFPDANRLAQITLLVGQHRAKTRFYSRGGAHGLVANGDLCTADAVQAADIATINADAGETIVATGDGVLRPRSAATVHPVARVLEVSGGFAEYTTY